MGELWGGLRDHGEELHPIQPGQKPAPGGQEKQENRGAPLLRNDLSRTRRQRSPRTLSIALAAGERDQGPDSQLLHRPDLWQGPREDRDELLLRSGGAARL